MTFQEKSSFIKVIISLFGGISSLTMDMVWKLFIGLLSVTALTTTIYKNYLEIKRIKEKE